ncbi:MAG: glycosyltransferase family 2 protein [Coriobacteriia bacterium]|nr:glycosyltransferase family 2 protein [Coriobacteriia bacterium]
MISIIIPVYNSEKYITKCIDSILAQTYKNFEIILVNDGSVDGSLKILNDYKHKYNNIKIYEQKNQGANSARKNGLDHSKGNYVTFIDSDDEIETDYLEKFVEALDKNTEVVICGFKRIKNDSIVSCTIPSDCLWSELKYTAICSKFYKKEILEKAIFYNYKIGEDLLITIPCLSNTKNIKFINSAGYLYRIVETSTTNSQPSGSLYNIETIFEKLLLKTNLKKYPEDMFMYFMIKTAVFLILLQSKNNSSSELNKLFKSNCSYISRYYKIKFHFEPSEKKSINILTNIFIFVHKTKLSFLFIALIKMLKLYKYY